MEIANLTLSFVLSSDRYSGSFLIAVNTAGIQGREQSWEVCGGTE